MGIMLWVWIPLHIYYLLQPHSLLSIIVYYYLPSDFYPLTITTVPGPCYYTIERGPVYLGELRERVLSITLYRLLVATKSNRTQPIIDTHGEARKVYDKY
jgi:hypothetical protein